MRPLRICLGLPDGPCLERTRNPAGRCRPCEQEFQRRRNRARVQYQGAWKATSARARRAQRWCSICGTTADLTLDHEHGQVECRSCNAAHRRNPA